MTAREPASIRYKNPGAMWGNALAIKWGAEKKSVKLNDGKGQGNNIAVFPTYVAGICAQLDLWRSSHYYKNKRFADAIATWSGGNEVESYIKFVLDRVPGMTRNTVMDDAFWRSPKGVAFLKAQAWHEAGKKYPAPDNDWIEAQKRVFDGVSAPKPKPAPEPAAPARPPARPAPEPEEPDADGFFAKALKLLKSKTQWAASSAFATSLLAYLTDWRIWAVIVIGLLAAYIIYERSKK